MVREGPPEEVTLKLKCDHNNQGWQELRPAWAEQTQAVKGGQKGRQWRLGDAPEQGAPWPGLYFRKIALVPAQKADWNQGQGCWELRTMVLLRGEPQRANLMLNASLGLLFCPLSKPELGLTVW